MSPRTSIQSLLRLQQRSEVGQRLFESCLLPFPSSTLSVNYGCQLRRRAINIIVKNYVLKIFILFNLKRCAAQSPCEISRRICAAGRQPLAQQLKRRRQNEDTDGIV